MCNMREREINNYHCNEVAQKKTYWTLLHLFLSVAALSHPMTVVVVANLIPPGFKIVLKFYNRLNEKQKRPV